MTEIVPTSVKAEKLSFVLRTLTKGYHHVEHDEPNRQHRLTHEGAELVLVIKKPGARSVRSDRATPPRLVRAVVRLSGASEVVRKIGRELKIQPTEDSTHHLEFVDNDGKRLDVMAPQVHQLFDQELLQFLDRAPTAA